MPTTSTIPQTTTLEPGEALQRLASELTKQGATVTAMSGYTIVGSVTTRMRPPKHQGRRSGYGWWEIPFSVNLSPNMAGGSFVSCDGGRKAGKIARRAIARLPR